VIIVSGTPGTGKTVFAKTLADEIGAHYVSLANYATEHRLYSGVDRRRETRIIDVRKARAKIRKLVDSASFPLIIDTHHPEGIVPNNAVRMVFVLRCDPSILAQRLRKRKWSREKITENVMSEILDYCFINARSYYANRRVIQLDTSRASVQRSVSIAKSILAGERPPTCRVDWLTKVSKSSSLSNYLKC
jgi:adenylate kinase